MKSTEIKDIVNSRILKTVKLPIEFENCDNPIIFKLLNSSLEKDTKENNCCFPILKIQIRLLFFRLRWRIERQ